MKDEISILMDGELDAEDAAEAIAHLKMTEELSETWAVYHLISDALGQSEVKPSDVARRVSARLAVEPTVLAPRPLLKRKSKVYAVAASITAAAVIGWGNIQYSEQPSVKLAANQPASQSIPTAPVQAIPVVSVSAPDPAQINDYLLAHRQFSPSTAMHGTAPYMMRYVTEPRENSAR